MRHIIWATHCAPVGLVPKGDSGVDFRIIVDTKMKSGKQPDVRPDGSRPAASLNEASPKEFLTTPLYGHVFVGLLAIIYWIRIAHPTRPIYILRVDTRAAFKHCKLHHAVIPLVAVWICFKLFYFTSLSFGQSFSPGEYVIPECTVMEVFARFPAAAIRLIPAAWIFAAQFRREDPVEEPNPTLAQAWGDELNPGLTVSESTPPLGNVFVDDALLIAIKLYADSLSCSLTALLWAKCCFFSPIAFPFRLPFINVAKLDQWFRRGVMLGYWVDTDALTVSAPSGKLDKMEALLRGWLEGSLSLTAKAMESMVGSIRYLSVFMPCGSFMLARLTENLNSVLQGCAIQRDGELVFSSGATPRDKFRTYSAPASVRGELEHLVSYMESEASRRVYLTCPIELLLWRVPRYHLASVAWGWGAGGFCHELRFAWRWQWPDAVAAWFAESKNINVLELAAVVVNFIMMAAKFRTSPSYVPVCFFTDNKSSRSWCALARMPTPQASGLGRLMCFWMSTSKIHSRVNSVAGAVNTLADDLSRPPEDLAYGFPSSNTTPYFHPSWTKQIEAPLISIPTPLASIICSAILYGTTPAPRQMAAIKIKIESSFSPIGL